MKAASFTTYEEFEQAAEETGHPFWLNIRQFIMPGREADFLKGGSAFPQNVPMLIPVGAWVQRTYVKLSNVTLEGVTKLIRDKNDVAKEFFCYGALGSNCTDQYDGARYRQAYVEVEP